jgi:hypothetical protein
MKRHQRGCRANLSFTASDIGCAAGRTCGYFRRIRKRLWPIGRTYITDSRSINLGRVHQRHSTVALLCSGDNSPPGPAT